jgi:hypothetical protein
MGRSLEHFGSMMARRTALNGVELHRIGGGVSCLERSAA